MSADSDPRRRQADGALPVRGAGTDTTAGDSLSLEKLALAQTGDELGITV
jgi:hypothetical protein